MLRVMLDSYLRPVFQCNGQRCYYTGNMATAKIEFNFMNQDCKFCESNFCEPKQEHHIGDTR